VAQVTLTGRRRTVPINPPTIGWTRALQLGIAGGLLVIPLGQLWLSVTSGSQDFGIDWFQYRDAAIGWLHGGSFYTPEQLAGPYVLHEWEPLYPPIVLPLLLVFAHLPDALWWIVPGGLFLAALVRMRPQGWWLPVTVAVFLFGSSLYPWWYGQPTIWLFPAVAWGLLLGGWAVFVLVKPSLFPFALIGIRRKSWWVTLAAFLAVCLPSGTLWIDWYRALDNSDQTVWYSLWQVPMMLVPVVAYLGRRPPRAMLVRSTGDAGRPGLARLADRLPSRMARAVQSLGRRR
jgi:hypothetical protein